MKLRHGIGLLLAAAAILHPAPLSADTLDYELIWSDEFDGAGVDPSKWTFQIGDGCPSLCSWGNNELEYYRAENATVSGGLLTITAREENFGGRDYTSARMRTVNLGDWRYGRIEMRAKMPLGQGIWPAFWMLPTDSVYGTWAASGETGTATSSPPAGDVWFLVAGREAQRYSSVGQAFTGERTLSGVGTQCPTLTAQDTTGTCP